MELEPLEREIFGRVSFSGGFRLMVGEVVVE